VKFSVWRAVALLVIAAATIFVCYDLLLPPAPDFGFGTAHPAERFALPQRVLSVRPGSPAARAGIRPGDSISFGSTALERARVQYALPGTRVTVFVNGAQKTLVAPKGSFPTLLVAPSIIRLAFLAVAALLAWRRPEDSAARVLVLFLFCYALLLGLPNNLMPTPLLSFIVLQIGSTILLLTGTGAAATFAAQFPSGVAKPVPRRLARTAQILVALGVVLTIVVGAFSLPDRGIALVNNAIAWIFIAIAALVVVTLAVAYAAGAQSERQRRRWVFLMLGIGLAAVLIDVAVQTTLGYSQIVDLATLLCIGVIPFGLAYVILRHRVIDVGFVLNRAVVYGAVSVIIVGIFVIVESLTSKYVEQHSQAGSIALQLAVALTLGFSIRFIHARVDRVVDSVLFRQRHLDEEAIKDFTHDAHYITSGDVVLERCVTVSLKHGRATKAGIWLRDGSKTYRSHDSNFGSSAGIDENDPALVAMRARRVVADLHVLGSTLPGTVAFPMIVRGELIGTLVCGAKEQGEAYAPDETAALRDMASAVGHALDAMRIRELEDRVAQLETSVIRPSDTP